MIGWVALALVVAAFTLAFVKQRMKKAEDKLNPSHYVTLVDGFPVTHVPRGAVASMEEAREVVVKLKEAYRATWHIMSEEYGAVDPRPMPIDTIGMSTGPVHPEHPEVVWIAPTGKMRLRFQPSMYYHFAGELHNMFRFNMYGIKWIYKIKNKNDRDRAIRVQVWIDENYKGE